MPISKMRAVLIKADGRMCVVPSPLVGMTEDTYRMMWAARQPDYFHDLDAINRLVEKQPSHIKTLWVDELRKVQGAFGTEYSLIMADANQRSIALFNVLNTIKAEVISNP